jgi:F-type H+-transporting ATPase subunit a
LPPTDNINTNIPCAIIVFLYYNFVGIREQGFIKYFKHFAGPIIWLAPLMFSIELISHLVRPLSLSVRLFGNITGDHMVLGIFSQLTPLVVPVIFLFLALFVAFIQAFVFSLLSTVYIALATEAEGD